MTEPTTGNSKSSIIGRTWRALRRPSVGTSLGTLLVAGFIAGIIFWGGFNWSMELTNTETFCVTCHEMEQNVYREYQDTSHFNNGTGVRATCPDCHVPKEWIHKVIRKVYATNELYHHFAGTVDTREKFEAKRLELATNVWRVMKETDSRECRNCHNYESMDLTMQGPRSRPRHEEATQEGKTCIDCHIGVAHSLPTGAFKAYEALSNGMNGAKQE